MKPGTIFKLKHTDYFKHDLLLKTYNGFYVIANSGFRRKEIIEDNAEAIINRHDVIILRTPS